MAVAVLPTPRVASSTLQVWILSPDSTGRRIRYIVVTFLYFSRTVVFDGHHSLSLSQSHSRSCLTRAMSDAEHVADLRTPSAMSSSV